MKLEGRRSARNLPTSLSNGVVVSAPANGDCFFNLVSMGIMESLKSLPNDKLSESGPSPKRHKGNERIGVCDSDNISYGNKLSNDESENWIDYSSVAALRDLVANEYSEDVFQLMVLAGQVPCTSRTMPTFDEFKSKLRNDRAFADEHCIGIISSRFSIAFLILDDNIGGRPTIYWNSSKYETKYISEGKTHSRLPKYYMTLRLGRQHYSGIRFNNKLLQAFENPHPQISKFWSKEIDRIKS